MRLLYLTAEIWPTSRADVAALFGKYLPRYGVYSDLVTGKAADHDEFAKWGGGEAILCQVVGGTAKKHIKVFLHGIRELCGANGERYDAIQVRDMPLLAAVGLVAARLKRLPFFYWMSYPMPEGQMTLARDRGLSGGLIKFLFPWVRGWVGRFVLYRVVLRRADHIFVQSERMKQAMAERGNTAEKMTPVPMGVDLEVIRLEEITPVDDSRLAGRRVLAYLGTLDRPRRIDILFEMLALVRRRVPEALLVLIGDTHEDSHRRWLRRQAEKAGVSEHVIWTGWLPMHEGWRYVRAAEIGLSPIPRGPLLDVGSPTKVLEYLVLGVPVVCNDNPDQQAIIEATNCGKCVPYTGSDFAHAVLTMLDLPNGGRGRMAEQGASYVRQQRDYRTIAAAVAGSYKLVCGISNHDKTENS